MNQRLIAYYINSLSVHDTIRLARGYGVEFNEEETRTVLPYLKNHRYELKAENKDILLEGIQKEVSEDTFIKIHKVLNQLLK